MNLLIWCRRLWLWATEVIHIKNYQSASGNPSNVVRLPCLRLVHSRIFLVHLVSVTPVKWPATPAGLHFYLVTSVFFYFIKKVTTHISFTSESMKGGRNFQMKVDHHKIEFIHSRFLPNHSKTSAELFRKARFHPFR